MSEVTDVIDDRRQFHMTTPASKFNAQTPSACYLARKRIEHEAFDILRKYWSSHFPNIFFEQEIQPHKHHTICTKEINISHPFSRKRLASHACTESRSIHIFSPSSEEISLDQRLPACPRLVTLFHNFPCSTNLTHTQSLRTLQPRHNLSSVQMVFGLHPGCKYWKQ